MILARPLAKRRLSSLDILEGTVYSPIDVGVVHFDSQHFSLPGHSESPLHDC